jgi:predicted MPP superfamily phosphohydrolase
MNIVRFSVVLSLFITIYGGLHYYLYRKLKAVLPTHEQAIIITLFILASSVIIAEIMTHNEGPPITRTISWIAFSWMGLVVLFFGTSVPVDLLVLLMKGIAHLGKDIPALQDISTRIVAVLNSPTRTIIISVAVIALAINGTFTAQKINVRTITLSSSKLTQPLRLVQITDLHIGDLTRQKYIHDLVDTINKLNPDIIVSTGDLVDMSSDHSEVYLSSLSYLQARLGKFAVYGNHETFVGINKSRNLTEQAGFTLLSNKGVTLGGQINLFGVDDPSVAGRMQPGASHPEEPTPAFSNHLFTVLLKHQPVVAPNTTSTFNLQLSGHVHGGQIYPFGLLTRLFYRVPMELSKINNNTWLYVSYGTGTWGPPMRVLAPPEITLFELQPAIK